MILIAHHLTLTYSIPYSNHYQILMNPSHSYNYYLPFRLHSSELNAALVKYLQTVNTTYLLGPQAIHQYSVKFLRIHLI